MNITVKHIPLLFPRQFILVEKIITSQDVGLKLKRHGSQLAKVTICYQHQTAPTC